MGHIPLTRILRSIVGTILTLLFGVVLVVLGATVTAAEAPDGDRDLHAYEAATRCPAAPSGAADCRWTQEFTVSSASHAGNSRTKSNRVSLIGADGAAWEASYSNDGSVMERLEQGDRVTATIWRRRVTEVAAEGASTRTDDAPADMRTRAITLALITIPSGLVMVAACGWRLFRHATSAPTPGMVATLGLSFGLFFAGLLSPLVLGHRGENVWAVAAVWLPVAVILTVVARVYVAQKRAPDPVSG